MEENILCTIVRYLWVPLVAFSFLLFAYLFIKYQREKDLMEKDKLGARLKYPIILLIFSLISISFWDFLLSENLLPLDCIGSVSIFSSTHIINAFSDNSSQKNISFGIDGGFNSDTELLLPRTGKITNVKIELEHDPEETWTDEFYNWSFVESHDSAEIDPEEGYAFLKTRKLDVNTTTYLDGTQIFDDVYIRKGGEIRVPYRSRLNLIIRGTLTIEPDSGINADGTLKEHNNGNEYDKNAGAASGGGGGGYGGKGGKGGDDPPMSGGNGGIPYGSETEPTDDGENGASGGGTNAPSGSGYTGSGGYGGSAVSIFADRIMLDGYISANGGNGEDSRIGEGSAGGGGGSGGSIIIVARNLILNGEITASGGKGGNDLQINNAFSDGGGGGGSGGRISITYNKKGGFGKATAARGTGGKSTSSVQNGADGGDGTVYWATKEIPTLSVITANITSKKIYFDNLGNWRKFYANATTPAGSDIRYYILNEYDNQILCTIEPKEALKGYDIETCIGHSDSIKLHAVMNTITFSRTPILDYWKIHYDTDIKKLEMDIGTEQITEYKNDAFRGSVMISDNNTIPKITGLLNDLAKECKCRGCSPTADYKCKVDIRFSSSSSGRLIVKSPEIEYYD